MNIYGDYVEESPIKRRGTKKKIWSAKLQEWQDVTVWTVPATKELNAWLAEHYPDHGWHLVWGGSKAFIKDEKIFLHYALMAKDW